MKLKMKLEVDIEDYPNYLELQAMLDSGIPKYYADILEKMVWWKIVVKYNSEFKDNSIKIIGDDVKININNSELLLTYKFSYGVLRNTNTISRIYKKILTNTEIDVIRRLNIFLKENLDYLMMPKFEINIQDTANQSIIVPVIE